MRITVTAAAVFLSIVGLAAAGEVEAAKRPTNIPAQGLGPALQALARDRDFQVIYISEEIEKLRTRGASGELTPGEALTQLLDGTGFTYRYLDEKTVTILPGDRGPASRPAATVPGATDTNPTSTSSKRSKQLQLVQVDMQNQSGAGGGNEEAERKKREQTAAEAEESTEIRVTGSRIRRDPAETDVSPVTVFTRQDIEHTGAATLTDFVGKITQASNDVTSRETNNFPVSGRTVINLRGLGNNTTLVLVNGRRLPKSGQGFGSDDYNLNGIPLASVERIEVLTNSASAIYGSDAIGGVVNIITRQEYSGIDMTVRYGNTFNSDVSQHSVNLTAGHSGQILGQRKYSLTLNAGFNDQNPLAARDREYTSHSSYADSGGRPPADVDFFNSAAGAGMVSTGNRFDPTPLPGLESNRAAIPANQDGRHLTAADFVSTDPIVSNDIDLAAYRLLMPPTREKSASLSTSLDLMKHVQWYVEGSYYSFESDYSGLPPVGLIPVPADNPFNPFGIDVIVSKTFYELGATQGISTDKNTSLATGFRGDFGSDWRYELSGNYGRYVGAMTNPVPAGINFYPNYIIIDDEFIEVPSPGSLAISDTNPATALNVFGDGRTTTPNDISRLRALLGVDDYRETSEDLSATLQLDGTVLQLPGGPLKAAIGGEFRNEKVDFYKVNTINTYFESLDEGSKRDLAAAFVELSVPLIGERQNVRGVRSLMLSLAGRLDSESMFGEEFTPKIGLMWRPGPSVALRATYNKGYKIPNLLQLFKPDITYDTYFFPPYPVDPVTREVLTRSFLVREGGNPDLNPERSNSWSGGVIYEPAWLPQSSLSIDYFDIDYTDRVNGFASVQDILTFFPDRVIRDPEDQSVILVDTRSINLSASRARGIDVRFLQRLQTTRGSFDAQLNYTYNIENTQQTTPTSEKVETIDSAFFPRVRANANVFWNYRGFELGPTVSYESSTRNDLLAGTAPLRIRHAIVVDLQGSRDFNERPGMPVPAWFEGMKLTLGIDNALNRTPSPTDGAGGYAKVDPRQRRYYVSLRKSF